jgi:hypothetical protein
VKVRLVDVAAVGGHRSGALPGGETVRRVVETDELRSPLGSEADLGPEPGPQTLAAPADLARQALDPNPPSGDHHLLPHEGDLRVHNTTGVETSGQRGLRDRKPLLPRPRGTQPLLGSLSISPPHIVEGSHHPAELRRRTQGGMRGQRREPNLEALHAPGQPPPSDAAGREPGDDTRSLAPTGAVLDNERVVAKVEEHRDGRMRDQRHLGQVIRPITEPGHQDTRQAARL